MSERRQSATLSSVLRDLPRLSNHGLLDAVVVRLFELPHARRSPKRFRSHASASARLEEQAVDGLTPFLLVCR